jgi:hypothetical protein
LTQRKRCTALIIPLSRGHRQQRVLRIDGRWTCGDGVLQTTLAPLLGRNLPRRADTACLRRVLCCPGTCSQTIVCSPSVRTVADTLLFVSNRWGGVTAWLSPHNHICHRRSAHLSGLRAPCGDARRPHQVALPQVAALGTTVIQALSWTLSRFFGSNSRVIADSPTSRCTAVHHSATRAL